METALLAQHHAIHRCPWQVIICSHIYEMEHLVPIFVRYRAEVGTRTPTGFPTSPSGAFRVPDFLRADHVGLGTLPKMRDGRKERIAPPPRRQNGNPYRVSSFGAPFCICSI